MATIYDHINTNLKEFIQKQHLFFTATAGVDGRVNVSPKGLDSLRVLGENRVVWMNLTGSGNETAAHILEVNRMTIMFCSFEKNPMILRLYGSAEAIYEGDEKWEELVHLFPPNAGVRQIYDVHISSAQTSCGYAVPFYEFVKERDTLTTVWTEKRTEEEKRTYWKEQNSQTIDGKPTGQKF